MRIALFIILFVINVPLMAQTTGTIKVRKKVSKLICLNGYTDGVIKPQLICGGKGLFVSNSDRYKIKSFIVLVESVREIEMKINGNIVQGEICETIDALKTGDVVYINKIVATDQQTGQDVNMPPLKFQIQNGDMNDKKQRYEILNNSY